MNRDYKDLFRHAFWQTLLLAFWIITAWTIDTFLMKKFPMEGMSLVSFRLLEVTLHLSTFRIVYRMVFPTRETTSRWWE